VLSAACLAPGSSSPENCPTSGRSPA
jgi:hypothetical protein